MTLFARAATSAYLAAAAPSRLRFAKAIRDPAAAQRERLAAIVRRNADTVFGRSFDFRRIASVTDYQQRVPLLDYEDYAAQIAEVGRGTPNVLTADHITGLTPSGGSSSGSKHIPWTASLKAEFSAATMPWVFDLLLHRPALRAGRSYWSISPPARLTQAAGVAVGVPDDSDYFPSIAALFLDRVLAVPQVVSEIGDLDTCRYVTLRALLATPDLAFISVWSPSFLTLLAEALDRHFDQLVSDLATGEVTCSVDVGLRPHLQSSLPAHPDRARQLRARFGSTAPEDLGIIWPQLDLISCWTAAHAARALGGMRQRFPNVDVQGKGLLATEGVVSVPLTEYEAPVCAVASHFLEFLPVDCDRPVLAHELEIHQRYEVVLTTGGGLYRYRLKDLIECRGHIGRTPLIDFVGRADAASDMAGEKLTPAFVERTIASALRIEDVSTTFAMLAPEWGSPPRYALYIEAGGEIAADRIAERVETLLAESHHYALCRALGQLDGVIARPITNGARRYEAARVAKGQRAGAIKPPVLERDFAWQEVFQ